VKESSRDKSSASSRPPTIAEQGFAEHAAELSGLDLPARFTRMYETNWMAHVDLAAAGVTAYVGGDVVASLVEANRARYSTPGQTFIQVDLTTGPLPDVAGAPADAVFCRDCLVHLSFANIDRVVSVVRASGARYLITTTFLEATMNADIVDGDWRLLNLERAPFGFPPPVAVLLEECEEEGGAYADKALAAWAVSDLPEMG